MVHLALALISQDRLPRTNNELEEYFKRIKSGPRRITGRKKVHEFVIRYGPYVTKSAQKMSNSC